jgi:arylsulfatase A-like enzyme
MKSFFCLFFAVAGCFLLSSCGKKNDSTDAPSVIRLFDIFEEDDLTGNVSLSNAGWERTLWRASDMSPLQGGEAPSLGFRALNDLSGLSVEGNALNGSINGGSSVLQFSLAENRGGTSLVKYIDVRMKVEGAGEVWLKTDGQEAVDVSEQIDWAGTEAWNISQEVTNSGMKIYRFDVSGDEAPEVEGFGDLRHFYLSFRDAQSGRFSIDSIRFVSQKEDDLNKPSGRQWAGLNAVFKETLAAKSSETFQIPLRELPSRPWLDIALGTTGDEPVTFTATISNRDGSELSHSKIIIERTIDVPDNWESLRIDLADYAGESVMLELALSGEKKGFWGYWGAPAIRSSIIPEAGNKKPRGVIFLVVDTLRTDHLNIFGYERETVIHLKKFADEGVAFSNAYAQGTWTKVSQPSMVTSLYPVSHTVLDMPTALPASAETIAEVYREAGYATVSFSSVPFTGKMNNMHQGYEELHETAIPLDPEALKAMNELEVNYVAKTSQEFVNRLIPWLEQHQDVPFFVFLHVFDPHSPFKPRPPYDTIWGKPGDVEVVEEIIHDIQKHEVKSTFGLPFKDDYVTKTGRDPDELMRILIDWYDGSIRGMDAEMGRLFESMRSLGLDDDTLMVFSSDHGEEFWEHGRLFHGQTVYGELSRVPLVFRWPNSPGFREGTMVDRVVENVDIMPTLLELSGVDGPAAMQGRSLFPLLDGSGEASWQDRPVITQTLTPDKDVTDMAAEQFMHFGFIENGKKVVRVEYADPKEELYDVSSDPFDLENLNEQGAEKEQVAAMTERFNALKSEMEAEVLPSDEEMAENMSSDDLKRLQALGYVGGGVETKAEE